MGRHTFAKVSPDGQSLVYNCASQTKRGLQSNCWELRFYLAGGAVADGIGANLLGDLNLALGNERAGNGGSEEVDTLVQSVSPAAHSIMRQYTSTRTI